MRAPQEEREMVRVGEKKDGIVTNTRPNGLGILTFYFRIWRKEENKKKSAAGQTFGTNGSTYQRLISFELGLKLNDLS